MESDGLPRILQINPQIPEIARFHGKILLKCYTFGRSNVFLLDYGQMGAERAIVFQCVRLYGKLSFSPAYLFTSVHFPVRNRTIFAFLIC